MKRFKVFTASLIAVLGLVATPLLVSPSVSAINVFDEACRENPSQAICESQDEEVEPIVKIVSNVLLFILGVISVIMIIIGGIRYTVSAGDQSAVNGAKNTILYSVIGLVVALLGYAIVNWILAWF